MTNFETDSGYFLQQPHPLSGSEADSDNFICNNYALKWCLVMLMDAIGRVLTQYTHHSSSQGLVVTGDHCIMWTVANAQLARDRPIACSVSLLPTPYVPVTVVR